MADLDEFGLRELCVEDPDFDPICDLLLGDDDDDDGEGVYVPPRVALGTGPSQDIARAVGIHPTGTPPQNPWDDALDGQESQFPEIKIKPADLTKNLGSSFPGILGRQFRPTPDRVPTQDEEIPQDEELPQNGAEYPPPSTQDVAPGGGWWKVGALVVGAVALFVIGKEIGG